MKNAVLIDRIETEPLAETAPVVHSRGVAAINIPRFWTFVSIVLLSTLSAAAEAGRSALEVGFSGGMVWGGASELVYAARGSDLLLSRLEWPLKPLAYWGLDARLEPPSGASGITVQGRLKAGLPGDAGTMTDTDWAASDGAKTHYSAHDGYAEQAVFAELSLGYLVVLRGSWRLEPYIGAGIARFGWIARDGYKQYLAGSGFAEWSEEIPKTPLAGDLITYAQRWAHVAVGFGAGWRAMPRLRLSADFSVFPVVFCRGEDNHLQRDLRFDDAMRNGCGFQSAAEIRLICSRTWSISFHGAYRIVGGTRGDVTISAIGSGQRLAFEADTAGSGYGYFEAGASLRIRQ